MVQFSPLRRGLPGTLRKNFLTLKSQPSEVMASPLSLFLDVDAADKKTETVIVTLVP